MRELILFLGLLVFAEFSYAQCDYLKFDHLFVAITEQCLDQIDAPPDTVFILVPSELIVQGENRLCYTKVKDRVIGFGTKVCFFSSEPDEVAYWYMLYDLEIGDNHVHGVLVKHHHPAIGVKSQKIGEIHLDR